MYVAFRDDHVPLIGYEDLFKCIRDLGLASIEMNIGRDLKGKIFDLSTGSGRKEAASKLEAEKVSVCALLVANNFAKEDFKSEIKWVVDVCRAAQSIGTNTVRIDVPWRPASSIAEMAKMNARCIREVIEETRDLDVSLGMENHGRLGNRTEFIREVLDTVRSERLGLTLDTGNFYWYGYPLSEVYEIIETFAAYVKHTHAKNLRFSKERREITREPGEGYPGTAAPLYEGDINLKRVVDMLKKAGYNKDLTVEDESLGNYPQQQRLEITKKNIEHLKSLT